MKKILQKLLGESWTRILLGVINWSLGRKLDAGDSISVSAGRVAIEDIQEAVNKLALAASVEESAVAESVRMFNSTKTRIAELTDMALKFEAAGDNDAAEAAAIECEQYLNALPKIESQMTLAQNNLQNTKKRLTKMKLDLKGYATNQSLMEGMQRMTEALEHSQKSTASIAGAAGDLERIKAGVERRSDQVQALISLSEDPTEQAFQKIQGSSALERLKAARSQKQITGN